MEAILAHVIIGFALLLFAVMAIGPLLIEASSSTSVAVGDEDDRVISIQPAAGMGATDSRVVRREFGHRTPDSHDSARRPAA